MNTAKELIDRSIPFLDEVKNRTAGGELETWLNDPYGPGSELYDDLAAHDHRRRPRPAGRPTSRWTGARTGAAASPIRPKP